MCELLNCTVRIPRLDLDGHPHKIQRKIPNLICRQGRKCASIGTTSIILPALNLFKFIDHLDDKCSPDLINCWSMGAGAACKICIETIFFLRGLFSLGT
jgi:hypothetical protein